MDTNDRILDFLNWAINLKKVKRKGWAEKVAITNGESVADHTYSMGVMGMILSDLYGYDTGKVLKMILIHDLAESITGDFTPGVVYADEKRELEDDAFSEIVSGLSDVMQEQYQDIWHEFQENGTIEAKMVHQIDKLEMALQAKAYENDGYPEEKLKIFFETAQDGIVDEKLKRLYEQIVKD